jgi:ketosteroid isomerase-like protein
LTDITQTEAAVLAAHHVAQFNDAVAAGSFEAFLRLFADDAVLRLDNGPGAGHQEYQGRDAFSRAYAEKPPDDQIDIVGDVEADGASAVVPFAWRRDKTGGSMRLTYGDGPADVLDDRLVTAMTITFS